MYAPKLFAKSRLSKSRTWGGATLVHLLELCPAPPISGTILKTFGRLLLFGGAFDHGRFVVELDLVY